MAQKEYKFKISANSEQECFEKASNVSTILKKTSAQELKWIADAISSDPKIIQKIQRLKDNPLVKKLL